jgi:FG-GAP-like repeat
MSLFQRWIKRTFRGKRPVAGLAKRVTKLRVEPLEDRVMPSVPSVTSINYLSPVGQYTNASSLTYQVAFSEPVTNVAPADFKVITGDASSVGGPITVSGPSGSSTYNVTLNGVKGSGTVQLDLVNNSTILSVSTSTPLANSFQGQVYTDYQAYPYLVSINRTTPSGPTTNATSVTYTVTFNEAVTGLTAANFAVVTTGAFEPTLSKSLSGAGAVYTVTVSGIDGDGSLGLNFNGSSASVHDLAGNPLVTGNAPATFQNHVTYSVSVGGSTPGPFDITAAVLTSNGIPDLVVANADADYQSIFMGNGDGTFQAQQTLATVSGSKSVNVADMNGDGIPDLVFGTGSRISVFLGNGNGTFQAANTYADGGSANDIVVADVNGDGIPDVVAAVGTGMAILIGNGDGTLQGAQTYATGTSSFGVAVGDLNGDGALDVVTTNIGSSNMSVFINNGNGSFQLQQTYSLGYQGRGGGVAIADVNGDGKADIAACNPYSGTISIFLGNGNGTFQTPQVYNAGYNSEPFSIAVADANGDGKPDLFISGRGANDEGEGELDVLVNNGNGTFQSGKLFNPYQEGYPYSISQLADLNGDGFTDGIIAESEVQQSPNRISVFLNNAAAGTIAGQVYTIDQGTPTTTISSEPSAYSNTTSATFSFTGTPSPTGGPSGAISYFQYRVDGGAWITAPSPVALSGLTNGSHTFQVEAVDVGSAAGPYASYTWIVDTIAPTVALGAPSLTTTSVGPVTYSVTVTDANPAPLTASEFTLVSTGTATGTLSVTNTGSGTATVTISNVNGLGSLGVTVNAGAISDSAGNTNAATVIGSTFSVLNGPEVLSINYSNPSSQYANTSSVTYAVTFNQAVTGVVPADFQVVTTGGVVAATPVVLAGSGASYTVTVNGIGGQGTLQLNLLDNDTIISTASSIPLGGAGMYNGSAVGETYTVFSGSSPYVVSINGSIPASLITNATSVTYTVTFNEAVTGVAASDFAVVTSGSLNSPSIAVSGTGAVYTVTVSGISGDGTLGLNLVTSGSIVSMGGAHLVLSTSFTQLGTFATGSDPHTPVLADVNGDGKLDLVVANDGGGTVGVLLGNGNGTFQAQQTYTAPSPYDLTVGDVNGDGKPDIVVGSFNGTGNAYILLGNGDGTFQTAQSVAAFSGGDVSGITVADVNHDGHPDLIAGALGGGVSVILGNGNGTFQTPQTMPSGSAYWPGVAVTDVNADGNPDIVVSSDSTDLVYVFLGNGNGTFQPSLTYTVGDGPYGVTVADVNGDGKPDIMTANFFNGSLSVLLGNGDGTFQTQQTYSIGTDPASVAVADVNVDGKEDLVVSDGYTAAAVLLGNGNGTFQSASFVGATGSGTYGDYTLVADLNADGIPDVVINNDTGNDEIVYLGGGAGGGGFTGQVYTIEQTPTVSITAAPPSYSSLTTASFSFVANNPTVGGPSNQENHFQYSLDGGGFITAPSPVNLTGLSLGAHTFAVEAVDNNGDAGPATSYGWTIGSTPLVTSINYSNPTGPTTGAFSVSYLVTFSGPVTGVAANDFQVVTTGNTKATTPVVVTGSGNTYTVTVNGIHGDGTLQLDLVNNGTILAGSTPLGGSFAGQTYTIQQLAPYLKSITQSTPLAPITNATSVSYTVTFSGPVVNVTPSDFQVTKIGSFASTTLAVTGTGAVYTVTVNGISGNGTVGIAFADNSNVTDPGGNALTQPGTVLAFQTAATFSTGAASRGIAEGDVNGDGIPDLVTLNTAVGSVSVLLGNGNGTFQAPVAYSVGTAPTGIAIAKLTGDGFSDIIVSNYGDDDVGVLLGNGDGTFQAMKTSPAGAGPIKLAVGDVNGDTIPDVVVPNFASNSVSVLLGNGDGTFQAPVSYAAGASPYGVTIADLNGDGKPDIVATNFGAASVSVLLGNGDGTFQAQTTYTVFPDNPSEPDAVVAADVNGDGKLDLIVNDYKYGYESVLLGNGNGTFQNDNYFYASGSKIDAVAVTDINGDGKLDLITANSGSNTLSILLGNGNGTFGGALTFAVGAGPDSLAVADFNGDGLPDVVDTNSGGGTVSVLLNTPPIPVGIPLSFQSPTQIVTNVARNEQVAVADLNGDGIPDVVTTNYTATVFNSYTDVGVAVMLGNGNGTYAQQVYPVGTKPTAVALADLNGDGILDMVVSSKYNGDVVVLMGNGNGTFQAAGAQLNAGLKPSSVKIADVNGDGIPDIVVADADGTLSAVGVLLGNGNGTFQAMQTYSSGTNLSANPGVMTLADVNGDGKPDVIVANENAAGTLSVLINNGNGTFQPPQQFAVGSDPVSVVAGTLNGQTALIAANIGGNNVSVLLGNGNGTFQTAHNYPVAEPYGLALASMTGDGNLDLVVSNETGGSVAVLLGNGNGSFQTQQTFSTGATSFADFVTVADLNGDKLPDIITANTGGGLSVLLGGRYETTIDQAPPTATILLGPPANSTSASATFTFTGSDPTVGGVSSGVSYFQYELDGGSYITATSPVNLTGLSNGSHTFNVEAVDAAGNASTPASYTWNVSATVTPIQVNSVVANQDFIPVNGASISAGVATLVTDGVSGFTAGNQIVVGGFTGAQAGFDGTYTILSVSGSQITYNDSNVANVSTTTFNTAGYAISANSDSAANSPSTTSSLEFSSHGAGAADTTTQHSMVDSIVYTFNTAVNLTANAVTLGIGTGTTSVETPATATPNVVLTSLNGGTIWVVTFASNSNATVTGHSIADGIYTSTLNSSLVTAVVGGAVMTTTRPADTFYRLFGDFNGDGRVNSTDAGTLNLSFGLNYLSAAALGYMDYFDYSGGGRVNSTSSGELNLNFGSFWRNMNATI